ncbi:MAG TPA: GH92 family glycosyl hydrolase [Candidatus Krumholzibacteria bacterium]|nr:GH92 family glycosyl hydrolase [Candidatus Krumholzibacteria bacterium]
MTRLLLGLLLWAAASPAAMVDRVDPFIGTGAHGHTFPGATVPFGMVQLSPDTRLTGWDGCSGYHFDDTVVYGFSHTHLSGTGVSDYGDVLFMPFLGDPVLVSGYPDDAAHGYGAPFRKADEQAAAGWYRTVLADSGIEVELTATARTGVHRYVFPSGDAASLIIDLTQRDELLDVGLTIVDDHTVEGFRRSRAWAEDQLVHFRAEFSRPFTVAYTGPAPGDEADRTAQAVLTFGFSGGEVVAQVALSGVDAAGARRNLEAERVDFDFAAARAAARDAWDAVLSPFQVEGITDDERAVLATAIYHSFVAPNLFSDVDGRYRGRHGLTANMGRRNRYTVFSLWDTYRATHPLFTLVQRGRTRDFLASMVSRFQQGGRLPVWELAGNETDCMIGYHSVSVLADAWLKGIDGVDKDLVLEAMLDSAERDHFGLDAYKRLGYIPADEEHESVSKTLEYAYDDACISRYAAALGRDDVAVAYGRRAQGWRHLFDPATRCFRPRVNGGWLTPYDPRRVDFHHTEANGWQYRFAAPHHFRRHMELLGGDAATVAVLDSLFTMDSATTGREQPDITGRMGQYAHGNEPSHHVAWLYHFAGRPDLSHRRVNAILREFYTDRPDGLIGNEDCGQMSSWYVLAAYGLYDVAPTSLQWLVVPPLYERMSIALESGAVFTTRRTGKGAVKRVTYNGQELRRSWLSHDEVLAGGELVFELGPGESTWGRAPGFRPGTQDEVPPIVAAPWATAPAERFRGRMEVTLGHVDPSAEIYWSTSPHEEPKRLYTAPLTFSYTTELRFQAVVDGRKSPIVTARYDEIPNDWRLTLLAEPNPQYTAGGPDALIDQRRGPEDWRTGRWVGFDGVDMAAELTLDRPLPVRAVTVGFLQDTRAWIVLPRELVVEVSEDGEHWREAGRVNHAEPVRTNEVLIRDLTVPLDGTRVTKVRVRATQYGELPEWHPGAGGKTFIFCDEVMVATEK